MMKKLSRNKISVVSKSENQFRGKTWPRELPPKNIRRFSTTGPGSPRDTPRKGSMVQKDILNPMDIWKNSLRKGEPMRYDKNCSRQ